MKKTMQVSVYQSRWLGDCTNGGVSAIFPTLYLEHPEGPFMVDDDAPALIRIVERKLPWKDAPYLHVEAVNDPRHHDGVHVGPMFGGNFVYSSDSRFPADYPLPVHDRYETQEQYDLLSD